eukprot:383256_1
MATTIAISIVIGYTLSQSIITTPTTENATHQYFNTSDTLNYASDTIICSTSYCHITCDEPSGCASTSINASSSDTLIIECSESSSCDHFSITHPPQTDLFISCTDVSACYYASINALSTSSNINLYCAEISTTSYSNAPCSYLDLNVSQASIVSINCVTQHSCFKAEIYAKYMNGIFNLNCTNDRACAQFELYAADMSINSIVNIICDGAGSGQYACSGQYYCPSQGTCNFNCLTSQACSSSSLRVPSEDYKGLMLNCDAPTNDACTGSYIYCTDTTDSSALSYDSANSRWICSDFGCCTFFAGDQQNCAVGSDCTLLCNTGMICRNAILNGSLANSLTVDCAGTTCKGAKILCPIGDNTICTIYCGKLCNDVIIEGGNGNHMNSFSLFCEWYTSNGCGRAKISLNSASITTVIINSTLEYDAYWYENIQFLAPNTVINDLFVWCYGQETCHHFTYVAQISGSVVFNCNGWSSCSYNDVTLTSTNSDVNYDINCYNSPPGSSNGACYGSHFYIHGYVDSNNYIKTNNMTIECNHYSCLYTEFHGYNINHVNINCKAPGKWSCREAVMDFESTNTLNLNCMSNWACQELELHCPWTKQDACKINCLQKNETCKALEVHVPDSYVFGYLDLNCASLITYPNSDACNGLITTCDQGRAYYKPTPTPTVWDDTAYFVWDSVVNDYKCTNTGARYCCPYYNATKDEVGICQPGIDCNIDCSIISCSFKIIDGSNANYLNVICGELECQYTVFLCPPGGCNILCNNSRACEYATFGYGGLTIPNTKVKVTCYGYSACSRSIMNMKYVNELELICQGRDGQFDRTCYGMDFQADYANKVHITAIERGAIDRASDDKWYLRYAKEVIFNGQGYDAIGRIYFDSRNVGSLELNLVSDLNWKYPVDSTTFYIPENTTINCYGYGCREIYSISRSFSGINSAVGLQINIDTCEVCNSIGDCLYKMNLYCAAGTDYWTYGDLCAGDSEPNTCGCLDLVNKIQFHTNYEEQKCATPRIIEICSLGSTCTYNCDSSNLNCKDLVIDGRVATSLTVNCADSNYCENTVIYCQNVGSCTLTCNAAYACTTAKILYYGQLSDNAIITINCQTANACDSMELNVENAESVIINADVQDSLISSMLRADYVGSLEINLKNTATNGMIWYIPQNTTFNCFGFGCYNLNQIHRVDINIAAGFKMNIATCGQCSSVEDCLNNFDLNCPNGVDSFTPNDPCTNSNSCGCKDIINYKTQLTSNYGELAQCNNNLAVHTPTCKSNKACTVDCTSSSCQNEIIDGRPGTSLTVNCGGSNTYCQNTFIHCGSSGPCVVTCDINDVCVNTKLFYDGSIESVQLECSTELSCNNMVINTKNAISFNVSLTSDGGNGATSGTNWFIPQNTNFHCYGTGCKNLNEINRGNSITSTGLFFNINTCNECDTLGECLSDFDLNCISGEDLYTSLDLCSDLSVNNECGCTDIINNNIQFTTIYSGVNCPGIAPTIQYCTAGIPCEIKCDNKTGSSCEGQVIVGGDATYLTVDCGDNYHCRNTTFNCPLAGCDINCNDTFACDFMKIVYNGKHSDMGIININCLGQKACKKINVKADYIYQINLICEGIPLINSYACERIKLHANHAEMVSIIVSEKYGSYYDEWNVKYANNILLDAKGSGSNAYALYRSTLYANYAGDVEINLSSDTDTSHPANYVNWYIPQNTTFNCFGFGCYNLNQIHRVDINIAAGFKMNIATCGQCSSVEDCLNNFDLNCPNGVDSFTPNDPCTNSNSCGCKDIINYKTQLTSNYGELAQCNNNLAVHTPTCKSNKACTVDCTSSSCQNEIIDGRPGTSLTVNCGGSNTYCQNTFIHCGSSGPCVVTCDINDVCVNTKLFYDGSIESVQLECSTELSCNNMVINTKNAISFNVSLTSDGGNGATSGTNWFIPQNTNFHCYGTGCKNLNEINRGNSITSTGLFFNINTCNECDTLGECLSDFDLNCISGEDLYTSLDLCSDLSVNNECGCTDIINNNIQFTTIYSGVNCPGIAPTIQYCTAGIPCEIKCDNKTGSSCEGQVIVGGDATYLTVDCGDNYHCRNTTFNCPLAGCDINCNDTFACDFMKIVYNGKHSDMGIININCLGQKACKKINVKADYIYQINLICEGIPLINSYACERIKLHANHAEMVSIIVSEKYGSYYDEWNVKYANNILLDAKGSGSNAYALYRSTLYANYAGDVEINLSSDTDTSHPANYVNWYIPQNT